jgi:triacylglycerol lipase
MTVGGGDYVVLLHGLGRGRWSMLVPRLRLAAVGFEVINIGYPSRTEPIEALAPIVRDELERRIVDPGRQVHFLTHSMGGIVLRRLLADETEPLRVGRIVMLTPPSRGSVMASKFSKSRLFGAVVGPAGKQLGPEPSSVPNRLGPVHHVVGVIAGNRPASPLALLLPGENDGTIRVDETKLEGMADFLVVPRGHTFIMNDSAVLDQAIHFFQYGEFERKA